MSDLTRFRDHCEAMATAEHKPECVERLQRWMESRRMFGWFDIPDPGPRPECGGCNPTSDRELFARLAAEVDDYLDPHPTLWGDDADSEPAMGARSAERGLSSVLGPTRDGESL